jgi:glycosyltransferase domain-containing protein
MDRDSTRNDLDKLTLVMLSYNRQKFILRSIKYWSSTNVNLIILDGSPDSLNVEVKDGNIIYLHSPISYIDRFIKSIDLIKTKYVALIADDDFLLFSGISKVIDELELDSNLVSCIGTAMGFDNKYGKVIGVDFLPNLLNYELLDDHPRSRILKHMDPYIYSTIYSVMRSEVWKVIISTFKYPELSIDPEELIEQQFELAACLLGKSKVVNQMMWLRSLEDLPVRVRYPDLYIKEKPTPYQWWNSDKYTLEKVKFLNDMEIKLKTYSNEFMAGEYIKEGLDLWMKGDWPMKNRIDENFIKYKDTKIYKKISWIAKAFMNKNPPLIENYAKSLITEGYNIDLSELEDVVKFITTNRINDEV